MTMTMDPLDPLDPFCSSLPCEKGKLRVASRGPTAADGAIPDRLDRPVRVSRRDISPANGRTLEMLGHAIEYLTDEYALSAVQAGALEASDPRMEAIQILMVANRQIYYSCPEMEPAVRRIARWIFRVPAPLGTDAQPKQPLS